MAYSDLRKGRYSQINQIYFITTVIYNRKENLFNDLFCARKVVNEMRHLHESKQVESIAWVIMPDHIHWLFQLQENTLSHTIKRLKARSAHQINCHLGRKGAVWQKAYHDHALRKEEDIKEISRYIVANPLRAGLVNKIGDYPLWDAIWM